ncbi:class II fumarate hydratase [Draconibacterium mangrovi]|uniref:class II fumarate hydratase n=1 Tax=Draconibacterium mangrovi TaxID=2697469 RepID=UPI0013D6A251|nr:class II fumarate hydratase [Draconibacterium mangrovi]
MNYRVEKDTLGEINVPEKKLWGAHTQRSLENFRIGPEASMPKEIIESFAIIKKAAARSNHKLGILSTNKKQLIETACDEILAGKLGQHFPLVIWQTGSGTHTNMNCNEVIVNRVKQIVENDFQWENIELHPIDDVNKSQSSNDTFSAAMHIAAYKTLTVSLLPALKELHDTFNKKSDEFSAIVKIGRTHFMDAVPITLGQEFSAYFTQIEKGINALKNTLPDLQELPLGGTAVGTGLNSPTGFDDEIVNEISHETGLPFTKAKNKFALIAGHDAFVQSHSAIKQLAVSLLKIVNDLRVMVSGPRAGISELNIPANEAGSSIMPGKVNPTQIEALSMVCTQVMGNDTTISVANSYWHFQLNVFKPVLIANFLQSATLLSDACVSFNKNCLQGITPDTEKIDAHVNNSLMLVTSLTPHIGYDKAAQIAKYAHANKCSLKAAATELELVDEKQFDEWVKPAEMTRPNVTVNKNM